MDRNPPVLLSTADRGPVVSRGSASASHCDAASLPIVTSKLFRGLGLLEDPMSLPAWHLGHAKRTADFNAGKLAGKHPIRAAHQRMIVALVPAGPDHRTT